MEGGNGSLEALKARWASGSWDDRCEIWGNADAMVRAQLVLMCNGCILDAEWERFYRGLIEENETYFVRGHAALALGASQNAETMLYLADKMDRDGEDFDTSEHVRAMCAQSMGRNSDFVERMPVKGRERILSILRNALENDEAEVAENAIMALGQLHDDGSASRMCAVAEKLEKLHRGRGDGSTVLETAGLAFCEMGLTENFAISIYVRVLNECPDYHVAETVKGFVEEMLMHSHFEGKGRLSKALDIYYRKVTLSCMAGSTDKPDSVVGAVFRKRGRAAAQAQDAKPPPLPGTRLKII